MTGALALLPDEAAENALRNHGEITDTERAVMATVPCREQDPELWFPDGRRWGVIEDNPAARAYARALCAGCPILERCRTVALQRREAYGVWGGTTPAERWAIMRGERR